jgi:serine/threonine protein phosphatase PrpC
VLSNYLQKYCGNCSPLQVMTNQAACDCIKDVDDAQKAAKKLVTEAKHMGSYDDISCIVVMF